MRATRRNPLFSLLLPLLALSLLLGCGGCAFLGLGGPVPQTDAEKLAAAHRDFDDLALTLTVAEALGALDSNPELADRLHGLEAVAYEALTKLDQAYLAGEPVNFNAALRAFAQAAAEYRVEQRKSRLKEAGDGGGGTGFDGAGAGGDPAVPERAARGAEALSRRRAAAPSPFGDAAAGQRGARAGAGAAYRRSPAGRAAESACARRAWPEHRLMIAA